MALSWTDVATETSYDVERSIDGVTGGTRTVTTAQNATTATDVGLRPSTTYFYRIIARNAQGASAPSAVASATTLADSVAPTSPSGLTANATKGRVQLRWSASSDTGGSGLAGYEVWRSSSGATSGFVRLARPTSSSYTDSTVAAKTTYWYYVVAFDGAGNRSAPSTVHRVTSA
jgi:fibronectin type 3 domain-containing protein